MKRFLASFLLLLLPSFLFAQERLIEYYRSNYNGLILLKIKWEEREQYKYYLRTVTERELLRKKYLYKENEEIKRWEYFYTGSVLLEEKYYKDRVIEEEYYYDSEAHKIRQNEYKSGKRVRTITYRYNAEGLVDTEEISNLVNGKRTNIKYRYDKNYKIKQIIKTMHDGRVIYWDSFFTSKGIIIKEYYTLNDETYIFYYNTMGQEIKGEVLEISVENDKEKENYKLKWENFYSEKGLKERKVEENFITGREIITWFNDEGKEEKVEEYKDEELQKIVNYGYDEKGRLSRARTIEGLDEVEEHYTYDENDNLTTLKSYTGDKLKKALTYENDKVKTEVIYGDNNITILVEYDAEGNIVSQETFRSGAR